MSSNMEDDRQQHLVGLVPHQEEEEDGGDDDDDYSFVDHDDDSASNGSGDTTTTNDEDEDTISSNKDQDAPSHTATSFLRQHLPAILIAIIAATFGHAHLNDGEFVHVALIQHVRELAHYFSGTSGKGGHGSIWSSPVAAPTLHQVPTPYSEPTPRGKNTGGERIGEYGHHHEYRRTANLGFCPQHFGDNNNNDNGEDAVLRLLHGDDYNNYAKDYRYRSATSSGGVNDNLVPFDFRIHKELVQTLGLHYAADERGDDNYEHVLADASSGDDGTNTGSAIQSQQYQCLVDKASDSNTGNNNVKGWSVAYIRPDISTLYRDDASSSSSADEGGDFTPLNDDGNKLPDMPSVKDILKKKREEHYRNNPEAAAAAAKREGKVNTNDNDEKKKKKKTITAVHTTFTGFAAKFTNLSPQPFNLYWDGRDGSSSARLVGRVPPFESLGTATTPGQSFSLIPASYNTYDDRYVVQRWTMTADEAHVYYDPYTTGDKAGELSQLTSEQRSRYDMWKLNQAYARDYLIKTKRTWLADFPRAVPFHYMWEADYFGRIWTTKSWERHFTTLPPPSELRELSYDQHDNRVHREVRYGKELTIAFPNHRNSGGGNGGSNSGIGNELELKLETISCAPQVFRIDNFLSSVEVEHIIGLAKDGSRNITLSRSTVHPGGVSDFRAPSNADWQSNEQTDKATRSSTNAWIEREASPIVDSIYRRAADLLRIDESLLRHRSDEEHPELATDHSIAERMQLVHYAEGEEYTPHHDFNYPAFGNRYQPGRFATLLLYLNDVGEGGETIFPRAISSEYHDGISVKPTAGTAVLFYNALPDGNYDDLSQHQSKKVVRGEKWMANLWIWDPIID